METNQSKLARKPFGEIVSDGFKLLQNNYGTLLIPLALFNILSLFFNIFILSDLEWTFSNYFAQAYPILDQFMSNMSYMPTNEEIELILQIFMIMILNLALQMLIGAVFTVLAVCSVASYVYKTYMNEDVKFFDEFKRAFNSKILLVILILGIIMPLGIFLVFIPSIFIIGLYFFYVFTYNDEKSKNPISESRAISKGAFWRIIGILIICFLIQTAVNTIYDFILGYVWNVNDYIYSSWVNPDTRNYAILIFYGIVNNIPEILLAPVFICLITPLFATHKARFEIGYAYKPSSYAPWRYQEQGVPITSVKHPLKDLEPVPRAEKGKGFYCPFCGHFIKSPKKFCINCGETLDFKF